MNTLSLGKKVVIKRKMLIPFEDRLGKKLSSKKLKWIK